MQPEKPWFPLGNYLNMSEGGALSEGRLRNASEIAPAGLKSCRINTKSNKSKAKGVKSLTVALPVLNCERKPICALLC